MQGVDGEMAARTSVHSAGAGLAGSRAREGACAPAQAACPPADKSPFFIDSKTRECAFMFKVK
jgi:hypothetical protein